jgi:pyrroloquinoline quinone biosynthesis protein B
MLNRTPTQVSWQPLHSGEEFQLAQPSGEYIGIRCLPVTVCGRFPSYVQKPEHLASEEATLGLVLTSKTGRSVGYFPVVGQISGELREQFENLDVLFFDGTFWSEEELIQVQGSGQRDYEMGHIPVGGDTCTLRQLADLSTPRKVYIHINNTNPVLNEAGPEYRAIRDAGWELAEDGWQVTL